MFMQPRKRIICNDGISLSVQVGRHTYCIPRDDNGDYTHVEVGFIEDQNNNSFTPPKEWEDYSNGSFPSDVYGYVPVNIVEKFILEHGGRKNFT